MDNLTIDDVMTDGVLEVFNGMKKKMPHTDDTALALLTIAVMMSRIDYLDGIKELQSMKGDN